MCSAYWDLGYQSATGIILFFSFTALEKVIFPTISLVSYPHMKFILSKCQLHCAVFSFKEWPRFEIEMNDNIFMIITSSTY